MLKSFYFFKWAIFPSVRTTVPFCLSIPSDFLISHCGPPTPSFHVCSNFYADFSSSSAHPFLTTLNKRGGKGGRKLGREKNEKKETRPLSSFLPPPRHGCLLRSQRPNISCCTTVQPSGLSQKKKTQKRQEGGDRGGEKRFFFHMAKK